MSGRVGAAERPRIILRATRRLMLGTALGGGLLVAGAALPGGAAWATCVASGPDYDLLCQNDAQGRLDLGDDGASVQIGPDYTIEGGVSADGDGSESVRIHLEDGGSDPDVGGPSVSISGGQTSGEVDAIEVQVGIGDVEITADPDVFIAPGYDGLFYGDGIHVEGTGDIGAGTTVRIDTAATIDADDRGTLGNGIDVRFEDYAEIEISNSGSIFAGSVGIEAEVWKTAFEPATGTIAIRNTGDITAGSVGILGGVYFGTVFIENSGDIDAGQGIYSSADSSEGASLTFRVPNGDNEYVIYDNVSTIISNTGKITARDRDAVYAVSDGGDLVVLNGVQTTVDEDYVTTAVLDGNGSAVTNPAATIDATAHGGTGSAIRVESADSVAIVNGGLIKGGDEGSAISVLAEDSAQVINLAGGKIYGDPSKTAVDARAYGGNITVSNGGDLYGSVSLLSDSGSVDFFNSDASGYSGGVGGTFHASGRSDFGGDGSFDNAFGTVKVDFGYDPVTGEPLELPPGDLPFANLLGLTSFDNSRGTIDLSGNGGGATLALGETAIGFDDDFTFHGSDEDGGRGSLVVDLVFSEEEGSIFSQEDSLQVWGAIEGVTDVTLNVLSDGSRRVISDDNLGFIALAANGDSGAVTDDLRNDAGNFVLKNVVGAGFSQYRLNYMIDDSPIDGYLHLWYLSSDVGARAYEVPQVMTAGGELWHAGAAGWAERIGELRNATDSEGMALGYADGDKGPAVAAIGAIADAPATGVAAPGIWARAVGGYLSRDTENSSTVLADGYGQSFWGLEGGVDGARELSGGGVVRVGVLAGYTGTNLDFDETGSSAEISGPSVGAYAGLSQGGAYVDMLGKVDFLSVEYGAEGSKADADGLSYGGMIEAGYRIGSATGTYVTPKASLAYVHTEIDDFDIFGTAVDFDGGESLRAKAGIEVGTRIASANGTVTPFVTAAVGNEFEGDNTVGLESGSSLSVSDDASGLFGEAGAGVVLTTGATSVYLKGEGRFAEDLYGGTGRAGVRLSW